VHKSCANKRGERRGKRGGKERGGAGTAKGQEGSMRKRGKCLFQIVGAKYASGSSSLTTKKKLDSRGEKGSTEKRDFEKREGDPRLFKRYNTNQGENILNPCHPSLGLSLRARKKKRRRGG